MNPYGTYECPNGRTIRITGSGSGLLAAPKCIVCREWMEHSPYGGNSEQ